MLTEAARCSDPERGIHVAAESSSFVSPKRISFDLGKGSVKATITSNNKIALRFRTADFDGEFFKYTNDLFLIYHSGHLGKLLCATK
jgi:hypothetical protein